MEQLGRNAFINSEVILMRAFGCAVSLAVLLFASLPSLALDKPPCSGIHVKILNIRNSIGTVDCALFDSPVGFPREVLHSAEHVIVQKIREQQAYCDFENIKQGTYAVVVIHDENMNGKLDTNFLGIPTEGYGFSNDVKAFLHPPSFSAASFHYDGGILDMTITLHY